MAGLTQLPIDAFIGYNFEDKTAAEKIERALNKRECYTWIYEVHSRRIDEWPKDVLNALERSRCFVVTIGPHGVSRWEQWEWRMFWNRYRGATIIPVLLPEGSRKHASIPGLLQDPEVEWVTFGKSLDEFEAIERLVSMIKTSQSRR